MSQTADDRPSPENHWGMRLLSWLAKLALYLPWIWLVLFALFVLAATAQGGHLPAYGNPDPKDVGFGGFLYYPIIVLLLIVMATIPIGVGLAAVKLLRDMPAYLSRREALAYLLGIGLVLLVSISDFAGLMTWLGD
jgi:hypothetical protein